MSNNNNNNEVIERVNGEIEKLKNKDFNIFIFTLDSKGTPSGALAYIYELALDLQKKGYNVKMLHQEKEFVGVNDWLGEEYANIEHINIEDDKLSVSASDFLLIPEVFATVMNQTKKLPCKRIAILQNYNFMTEFIPLGSQWANFGIQDAIVSNKNQYNLIVDVFPYVKAKILSPQIKPYFRKGVKPKKLIINIVTKEQVDVNRIVKPFYWKYPMFKWVSFRDLRGFPQEQFSDLLREGIATVWIDDDAQFGYAPLEAIKSGNIVIGKIPKLLPEWMANEDQTKLLNNGIWFDDINSVHSIIYSVVKSWIKDDVPEELYEAMEETNKLYTKEEYEKNVDTIFNSYIDERIKEFENFKEEINTEQKAEK